MTGTSEIPFIAESTFNENVDKRVKEIASLDEARAVAVAFLTRTNSQSMIDHLEGVRDRAEMNGNYSVVDGINQRLSQAAFLQQAGRLLSDDSTFDPLLVAHTEEASHRGEILAEATKYLTPGMQTIIGRRKRDLAPYIVNEHAAKLVSRVARKYEKLDSMKVPLDQVGTFLDNENSHHLRGAPRGADDKYEPRDVNNARFGEVLDAVLAGSMPDVRDLNIPLQIIEQTKNKFLRKVALKKTVQLLQSFPKYYRSIDVAGHEVYPSISRIYEEMKAKGLKMPLRDFFFTLPMVVEDGVIREDLLQTASRIQELVDFNTSDGTEGLYFGALVDLVDPARPQELQPLLKIIQRELSYTDSYYAKHTLPAIQKDRKERGLETTDKFLTLTELRKAIKQAKTHAFKDAPRLFVEKNFPDDYTQLLQEDEQTQQEYIETYSADFMKDKTEETIWNGSDESKETGLTKEEKEVYWTQEVSDMAKNMEKAELSKSKGFEELLKKLSAIKLTDKQAFHKLLAVDHPNLERMNNAADQLQLFLFFKYFELTPHDRDVLGMTDKSVYPPLVMHMKKIHGVYKEFGNFNPFLFLKSRYEHPHRDIDPKAFRENLTPLLKGVAYHVAKGDFKQWRGEVDETIGHTPFKPLDPESNPEKAEQYEAFWRAWNADDATQQNEVFTIPDIMGDIAAMNSSFEEVVANPSSLLRNPALWKERETVSLLLQQHTNPETFVEEMDSVIKELDVNPAGVVESHHFPIKASNAARLVKIKQLAVQLQAFSKITKLMEEKTFTDDTLTLLSEALSVVNPHGNFASAKNLETNGDESGTMDQILVLKALDYKVRLLKRKKQAVANNSTSITVMDTSNAKDLLTVGQRSKQLINCMSYDGDNKQNAYIMDIATSRNKKLITIQKDGKEVARGVLKVHVTKDGTPVIAFEDILTTNSDKYHQEISSHLKERFGKLGVIVGEPIKVHSNDSNFLEAVLDGRKPEDMLTADERTKLQAYKKDPSDVTSLKEIVVCHSTGSRVGAEMVEVSAAPGARAENTLSGRRYQQFIHVY